MPQYNEELHQITRDVWGGDGALSQRSITPPLEFSGFIVSQ